MNDQQNFSVESDSLDTKMIQSLIEERARERREKGLFTPELQAQMKKRLPEEGEDISLGSPLAELDFASAQAERTWQVSTAYEIATEKKFARPLILFIKRLGRLWARLSVGPIQRNQTIFNRYVTRALGSLREEAIRTSAELRAREHDLCMIAEALSSPIESEALAKACVNKLGGLERVFVVGPAPPQLTCNIREQVDSLTIVNISTPWDGPVTSGRAQVPSAFLEELEDESSPAIMIPEICFWLRPDKLPQG